ncbi:hypothetical protein P280DRAFT_264102 [Massarina eburnea CBS 473.64]|uniref:Uncharacterized protein n=1 Tax=Massarina eburnea CBS 473.64 TaxID=1395130 RepID=A0A6A6S3I0_9PLEO|nr:hypothetical protein P280DRAFT_264102 [Massarina eburnea CBS 473.64]
MGVKTTVLFFAVQLEQAFSDPWLPTIESDWQKDNITAKWATGHPKQWIDSGAKFIYSDEVVHSASSSADNKYIAILSNKGIGSFDYQHLNVSHLHCDGEDTRESYRVRIAKAPGAGYDVLVSTRP